MNNSMMWGMVVIALIIGVAGGFYMGSQSANEKMMMMQTSMQKLVDEAKMASDKMMKDEAMKQEEMKKTEDNAMMQKDDKMMPVAK